MAAVSALELRVLWAEGAGEARFEPGSVPGLPRVGLRCAYSPPHSAACSEAYVAPALALPPIASIPFPIAFPGQLLGARARHIVLPVSPPPSAPSFRPPSLFTSAAVLLSEAAGRPCWTSRATRAGAAPWRRPLKVRVRVGGIGGPCPGVLAPFAHAQFQL